MLLKNKRGLIIGIANENSIAYGCAKVMHAAGAELAITYLNTRAEPYVRPLAEQLESPLILPCDVRITGQLDAVFSAIAAHWGNVDFVLHSTPMRPPRTYARALSTAHKLGLAWRWMCLATPLSALHV